MIKDNFVYLKHILDAIDRIEKYTKKINQNSFSKNNLVQSAVIREIEIIGEAAKRLSNEFKEEHSGIPWKQMAGMRDKLIHDYFGVDLDAVWGTVKKDIPILKKEVGRIFKKG